MITLFLHLLLITAPTFPNDTIEWSDARKLAWTDFKAKPQSFIDAAALTSSGISIGYEFDESINKYKVIVTAFFTPSESWVKADGKNNYVLNHEQQHFNITELYVRKMRKAIAESNFTSGNISTVVNKIYKQYMKEWDTVQKQYDAETKHSIIEKKQEEWNIKIAKWLKEFQNYS